MIFYLKKKKIAEQIKFVYKVYTLCARNITQIKNSMAKFKIDKNLVNK